MCEYCDRENPKSLSERALSKYHDGMYTGIACTVDFNSKALMIEACPENGYDEPTYGEIDIEINYCPMCGRKLNTD